MMSFLSFARRRQNQNRRHARRLNGCWERSLCRKRGPGRRRSAQDGSFEQEQTEITERCLVAVDGREHSLQTERRFFFQAILRYFRLLPLKIPSVKTGARGGGRTHNLRLRRPTLYPIELLARTAATEVNRS